jgi:hypothetical protein
VLDPHFTTILTRSMGDGLDGAALVDRNGNVVALAGSIAEEEAMPLVALVMYRLKSGDLASRLFAGEVISLALDERGVAIGVAKRQLFVVVVLGVSTPNTLTRVQELRDAVARILADEMASATPPWSRGSGGSESGPAELPLVEFGITVRRERGKA